MKSKPTKIGQGETSPDTLWIMFDKCNGNFWPKKKDGTQPGHRYIVWFHDRKTALSFKRHHDRSRKTNPHLVEYSMPVQYLKLLE